MIKDICILFVVFLFYLCDENKNFIPYPNEKK